MSVCQDTQDTHSNEGKLATQLLAVVVSGFVSQ